MARSSLPKWTARVPAMISPFPTAGWGKIWRIKEAKGSLQSSLKEGSLKLPHDTSNFIQNLIKWSHLSIRDNRKCYFIWNKIFPDKNCDFYSHGRKEWILNNGSLYHNYKFDFYRWGNENSESSLWLMTHLVHVRARVWIPFFLIQIQHWFHYITTSSIGWNVKWLLFHNHFLFPQNWHSITVISIKSFGQVNTLNTSQHQLFF